MSIVNLITAGDYITCAFDFPRQWRVDTPDLPGPEGRGIAVYRTVCEIVDDGHGGSTDVEIERDAEYYIGATPMAAVAIAEDIGAYWDSYDDLTEWVESIYEHPYLNRQERISVHFYGFSDLQRRVIRAALTN
ncbi:hypothetical protein HOT75_gp161 [Gordonia phage Daredevil]|uniref:Uncharacterized protein n=1 Tax=Gordonia phage Daredevil TaxID=2283286 RepID=A0A345MJ16_9CAUD|nr:hypothetical protein HOT75_gp161 [Gordonia phage Daredevil]AXH70547.1 hypothetical protein SEA_DAREDEVIL_161 [Gordonia phage Daredevil]